jgi:hypothetical protein
MLRSFHPFVKEKAIPLFGHVQAICHKSGMFFGSHNHSKVNIGERIRSARWQRTAQKDAENRRIGGKVIDNFCEELLTLDIDIVK